MKDEFQIETMAVHAGEGPCPTTGALDTPIYMSSSFAAPSTDELAAIFEEKQEGYVYTRYG
ncbi:MAG: PLP-dependent transferase, partial [Acidobacteria bacterium]|nr:PLP-dependent transferase [Acidobacteriota bacterium]